jgi:hypothetical protein
VPILRRLHALPLHWLLLSVSLLAVVPRLYLGVTRYIEYDGYWHVFVAMQEDWHQFYQEYQANFHPPLFYLLLKLAMWFGRTPLVYRAISLLTGVAAVFVTGKIAERLSFGRYTPVVAALAFGLALPSIIISCEVRSYMLSVFFLLVSFYYFLDVLRPTGEAPRKSRALFAVNAILAGYSHYGAFFYVCSCLVAAVSFDLFLFRRKLWTRLAQDAVTFGAIAGTLAFVYWTHAHFHARYYPVVAEQFRNYYFEPGRESLWEFLARNSHGLFGLFFPWQVAEGAPFHFAVATLILAGGWLVYLIRRLSEAENIRAMATLLIGLGILSLMAAGGALRRYPYGGELRHQFFLFPFAILCGCILLDRITTAVPRLASALVLSAVAATIASWSFAFAQYPKSRIELGTAQMTRFRKDFPAPTAVFVDQFNVINFFIHYHAWHWQYVGRSQVVPAISIYRVSRGTENFVLLRDPSRWNLDFAEQALYNDLAKCIRAQQLPSLTVYYTRQQDEAVTIQKEQALANLVLTLAARESLCVSKLRVEGVAVSAEFKPGQCDTRIEALVKCSSCDDTSWSIDYFGNWRRGEFDQASNATLTYTDDPAASARLSFEGSELRYVYTKAFNRGLAAISIDGVAKGVVDLYSPRIEWQSSSVFGGLPPGRHTLEIRVTGRHNSASTGAYIDIDALETR